MAFVWIETEQEFIQKHGGNPLTVADAILLPSGAMMSRDRSVRYEPAKRLYDRLRVKRDYWVEKKRLAEEAFNDLQSERLAQASMAARYANLPGVAADETQQELQHIKGDYEQAEARIKAIDALLEKTPEVKAIRDEQRRRESFIADQHRATSAIANLTLG